MSVPECPLHTDPPASARYKSIWGAWFGREREFFERCAELVSPLRWADVMHLCGQDTRLFSTAAVSAYQSLLSEQLPPALKLGGIQIIAMNSQSVSVTGYEPLDPIEMPRELFDALAEFDGKPTADTLRSIFEQHDLELGEDLIRRLVDFTILIPSHLTPGEPPRSADALA